MQCMDMFLFCGENNNRRHLLCAASEMGKNNMGDIGRKKTLPSSEVKDFSTNLHQDNVQTKLKCHDKRNDGKTEI